MCGITCRFSLPNHLKNSSFQGVGFRSESLHLFPPNIQLLMDHECYIQRSSQVSNSTYLVVIPSHPHKSRSPTMDSVISSCLAAWPPPLTILVPTSLHFCCSPTTCKMVAGAMTMDQPHYATFIPYFHSYQGQWRSVLALVYRSLSFQKCRPMIYERNTDSCDPDNLYDDRRKAPPSTKMALKTRWV